MSHYCGYRESVPGRSPRSPSGPYRAMHRLNSHLDRSAILERGMGKATVLAKLETERAPGTAARGDQQRADGAARGPAGWSVKDIVAHIAVWGRPGWPGSRRRR